MNGVTILLVACAFGLALYAIGRRWLRVDLDQMRADYERDFPGGCFDCAYFAFGRRNGWETRRVPPPHRCPERMERWRGALHDDSSASREGGQ